MKVAVAALAVLALASCSSAERSQSTGQTASAGTRTETSTGTSTGGTTDTTEAPDVARLGGLPKIRSLEERDSRVDPRLEDGVRAMSGLVSAVRCWNQKGWEQLEEAVGYERGSLLGLTDVYAVEIHLNPWVCQWLDAQVSGDRFESGGAALAAAESLVVLAHEGAHLSSAGSYEALAECRAMQLADEVAAALGIDQSYAQGLSELYWEQAYPRKDPRYRSPECRNGGAMDLNPDDFTWP
jgi:hypothetical protein